MMNAEAIEDDGTRWLRIWVQLRPEANPALVRQKLHATLKTFRVEKAKSYTGRRPQVAIDQYVNANVFLNPASAGASALQTHYRQSLKVLGVLVALVLLIACANVANLFTAQAAARAREMALRVSIGAGRGRLIQLVMVESALVALFSSALGGAFAWWAAPQVVSAINPPYNPARLTLPADWRVLGFAVLLALAVTFLFGLVPALRASAVKPVSALKGGEDPHARRRLMHGLVAAQVAFCFLVHFVAGLFVASFDRLSHQPTGFDPARLLLLVTGATSPQPPANWDQVVDHLRTIQGVQSAALSDWALMTGSGRNHNIAINGALREDYDPYFLGISPGWLETMRIPMIDGRDFRPEDRHPKVAIVNERFAKVFFGGQNPVGKTFTIPRFNGERVEIVGLVRDAVYSNQREGIRATAYTPAHSELGHALPFATFLVRAASDDLQTLSTLLRREVSRVRPEFRVSTVRTQTELVQLHTIRERLLAALALFFAGVSLMLAAVGLFGVLDYAVQRRRREIGIRLALGAPPVHVAGKVTVEVFAMVLIGAAAGLAAGVAAERYIESLLYQVKATDLTMLVLPTLVIFAAAVVAALPPVIRAVRIDPAGMLRAD
jgi:predicted permease